MYKPANPPARPIPKRDIVAGIKRNPIFTKEGLLAKLKECNKEPEFVARFLGALFNPRFDQRMSMSKFVFLQVQEWEMRENIKRKARALKAAQLEATQ